MGILLSRATDVSKLSVNFVFLRFQVSWSMASGACELKTANDNRRWITRVLFVVSLVQIILTFLILRALLSTTTRTLRTVIPRAVFYSAYRYRPCTHNFSPDAAACDCFLHVQIISSTFTFGFT